MRSKQADMRDLKESNIKYHENDPLQGGGGGTKGPSTRLPRIDPAYYIAKKIKFLSEEVASDKDKLTKLFSKRPLKTDIKDALPLLLDMEKKQYALEILYFIDYEIQEAESKGGTK